ncbi:hypothetical protein ACFFKE_32505 [Streptomyces mutabilis]|uniref:hypothetical protein n=1 Tax=Streptomyces mutabilis TaxID=67332 RepID=UPI0017817223|nr:hypothetical protein [Streptomyces mutabilis]GGQ38726.1 hypothetical protein GCM10010279_55090 [Streptomyces mutabilis]
MEESTQNQAADGTPTSYGYCSWHDRFSEGVRLIRLGSGDMHYACVHCVRIYKLTPYEDQ